MKLKNLIPQRFRRRLVRQFGQAKLVKLPNGQHELIGGTDADRAAAFEWTSLFANEIVFTHFLRENKSRCSPRKTWFAPRFQPAV
jgi:hypothetical protein